MCMALTRHSPSRTPLFPTAASTSRVMFRNAMRAGRLNVRCSVCDFMTSLDRSLLLEPFNGPGNALLDHRIVMVTRGHGHKRHVLSEPLESLLGSSGVGGFDDSVVVGMKQKHRAVD